MNIKLFEVVGEVVLPLPQHGTAAIQSQYEMMMSWRRIIQIHTSSGFDFPFGSLAEIASEMSKGEHRPVLVSVIH